MRGVLWVVRGEDFGAAEQGGFDLLELRNCPYYLK